MSVMGVKTGTKAFSDAPQNEITKADRTNLISASALGKFGEEGVGDALNKIADPNWVDPSKKPRAVGNDKLDKDSFMKLMLAQMKHQDPTNPMQSHELAAQLAQFSSVEQMQNMNSTLNDIKAGQKPTESFQALNFIGKAVSGDSSKLTRAKGDKSHDISFSLPDSAKEGKIRIRDSSGETVRTVDLKDLKKGSNNYVWNGLDEKGNAAPSGDFQMFIEAINSNGQKLAAKTDFEGVITGVNYTPEGPVLLVGTQSVKLKDVKKIVDPSLMKNDQNMKSVVAQDLKKPQAAGDNENKEEEKRAGDPPVQTTANMISNVGMSRDMMAKLEKDTKAESQPGTSVKQSSADVRSKMKKE